MKLIVGLTVVGVSLLQLDSWVLQTRWLALIGVALLILSMFLIFNEGK
jgi:hypothetical protein